MSKRKVKLSLPCGIEMLNHDYENDKTTKGMTVTGIERPHRHIYSGMEYKLFIK